MDWIRLAQDRAQSPDRVDTIINFPILKNLENIFTNWANINFSIRSLLYPSYQIFTSRIL
jgi:hypothetical protein